MSIELTVAVISAVVALLSILLSARATRSNTQLQARLQAELEQSRNKASKAARLEEIIGRYRDPLLSAAFELQSRIYNFVCGGFAGYLDSADPAEQSYTVNSTLFVIAQYFAWTEALRRGIQFFDLGDLQRNRQLVGRLEAIRSTFSTDMRFTSPFRIFRAEQRAIGELMLEPSESGQPVDMPGSAWDMRPSVQSSSGISHLLLGSPGSTVTFEGSLTAKSQATRACQHCRII